MREIGPGGLLLAIAMLVCLGSGIAGFVFLSPPDETADQTGWLDRATWIEPRLSTGAATLPWQRDVGALSQIDRRPAGHLGGNVWSVAFSPDGSRFASGGDDGTIRLWSAEGEELASLAGHDDRVRSVAFSPDGSRLASGGDDGTIRLWSADGEELASLTGHVGRVRSVAFSPDGRRLASGGSDGTIRLWSAEGEELASLTGHNDWVKSVAFSPDGSRLASGGFDRTIRLWSAEGEELASLTGHDGPVWSVAFSPDGSRLASSGDDGTIRLWSAEGEEMASTIGHLGSSVLSVAFSPDGSRLASGGDDGTIRLWSAEGEALASLTGHDSRVRSVAFSPDGSRLASGGDDGTIRLRSAEGEVLASLTGHSSWVRSVAFSPDGSRLASGGDDGTIRLRSAEGEELASLTGHDGPVWSVAFSPDGSRLASGGEDGTIRLWSAEGEELASFTGHVGRVRSVAFSPDGRRLASGGSDGRTRLWSAEGEELASLTGHAGGSVLSVAFSPDSSRLASGGFDRTIRLWSAEGEELASLTGHNGRVSSVAFSPDGSRLASGGFDGTIRMWSAEGEELASLTGHDGSVWSVAFSPDGSRLASGGSDGTIRMWSAEGAALAKHGVGFIDVTSVAMDDDDRLLAGDTAGRLILLQVRASALSPAPASWVLLLAGLCGLAGCVQVLRRAIRRIDERLANALDETLPPVAAFLEADGPLENPDYAGDAMRGLTERLSVFIRNRNTAAPLTFALTGDWGSGKSSVMKLVERDLDGHGYPHIWFNAWHHQNETHLFAALMEVIRKVATPPALSWPGLLFHLRLAGLRFTSDPLGYLLRIFGSVLVLAALALLTAHMLQQGWPSGDALTPARIAGTGLGGLLGLGAVWALLAKLVKPFGVRPANLILGSASWFQVARFGDRLAFRHRFGQAFGEVCRASDDRRLVIIIDDLDRCQPQLVVEVLEAVNFLASNGDCFIIMGISEEPVLHAVGLSFKEMAAEQAAARAVENPSDAEAADHEARRHFAERYLEKLINLRIKVPRFDSAALKEWMDNAESIVVDASQRDFGVRRLIFGSLLAAALACGGVAALWSLAPEPIRTEAPVESPEGPADLERPTASEPSLPVPGGRQEPASGTAPETDRAETGLEDPLADERKLADAGSEAAGDPGVQWSEWPWAMALGAASIALMLLAFLDRRLREVFRRHDAGPSVIEDSEDFRKAFADWAPLVLASGKSPRSVKRFANRMRYLAAGIPGTVIAEAIPKLMALGALDEVGAITSDVPFAKFKQDADLRETRWRQEAQSALAAMGSGLDLDAPLKAITETDWNSYWELAASVRFASVGAPLREAPEAATEVAAQ